MDEARIFRERFQQGTAYMSEELKSIEKNATGTFKEPENQQLEREYMSAMEQGHVRMRLFGMQTTSFGKMEFATTEVMQSYCEERKEASRIRQITESGKKKKSRQETDAQARMGDRVNGQLKRSADASAANVLQMYREKKEQNHQPADPAMQAVSDQLYGPMSAYLKWDGRGEYDVAGMMELWKMRNYSMVSAFILTDGVLYINWGYLDGKFVVDAYEYHDDFMHESHGISVCYRINEEDYVG